MRIMIWLEKLRETLPPGFDLMSSVEFHLFDVLLVTPTVSMGPWSGRTWKMECRKCWELLWFTRAGFESGV